MKFGWLKRYLPRGIYGRAALILVLPVVTIQLVVFVAFAQRHFTEVTEQMSNVMESNLVMVFREIAAADTSQAALERVTTQLEPLEIAVEFVEAAQIPTEDGRIWYDFTGTVFAPRLRARFPQIIRIDLSADKQVSIYAQTHLGPAHIYFHRSRISSAKPHQLYVNMVFFGVLMTVIAYIYLRNQLRPITRLAEAAEAFGRGFHIPYHPGGAVEVRAAGTAFVQMRNRLDRYIEQRTLMLSGVSHDLRTPLTRLRLGLSMLEDEDRAALEADVDDMQRLVDEFLNFTRSESEAAPELTDPIALAMKCVEDAQRSDQDVEIHSLNGAGEVILQPVAMRRALDNLVGNAVRYGSRAEVSVLLTEKSLRFRVEDDGPGIPEAQRMDALRPFVRLDRARNQNAGAGVGLGLAIATDIARSHGGVLRLGESDRLGGLSADIVIAR